MQPFGAPPNVTLDQQASAKGDGQLVAVAPLATVPWSVVIARPSAAAFAPIDDVTGQILLLILPALLVACALSVGLALQISLPLRRLRRFAHGLAAGDLRRRLNLSQRDEVGELGRAFDQMAQALEERTSDLQRAVEVLKEEAAVRAAAEAQLRVARDELEQRVRERTAALLAAHEDLIKSEERLSSFVQLSGDGIVIADDAGRVTMANGAAARMFGYELAELNGKQVEALLPAGLRESHVKNRALFSIDPHSRPMGVGLELRGQRKDGSEFPVDISLTPLQTRDGFLVAATVRDITERRRREEELSHHRDELARSNAELEQFAYVASHDLQEPLRMVSNYTQLLARRYAGRLDADADAFIGFAVDGARRMQQLINDLLNYSQVGTKGKELQPVKTASVVERALKNLGAVLEESGAIVEFDADSLPAVLGDDVQLLQLFQNLLANAIKFRRQEAPRIRIAAEREGDAWTFAVRDNGIGIDQRYWDRIFVIFQRLHGRDDYPGTGIGLALCKRIVERHGGRIWLDSAPGEGTTIYFTLSAARSAPRRTPVAAGRAA
jgi:PAS domain S-box-containing protein